jgi:hypothetical protein
MRNPCDWATCNVGWRAGADTSPISRHSFQQRQNACQRCPTNLAEERKILNIFVDISGQILTVKVVKKYLRAH